MAQAVKKKNVYDIVTERICDQLKKGVIPWEKPWISVKGERVGAWGHSKQSNGKPYSLLNQMMLPLEGEYVTFKQIRREGGTLKKGSKGYPIVFWDSFKTKVKNNESNIVEEIEIPCLKYYTVFHISDTEGITQNFFKTDTLEALKGAKETSIHRRAEEVIKNYLNASGVTFKNQAGDEAYYSPFRDLVIVPLKKQFDGKRSEYYSTVFHELVHSTGHKSRLNRFGTSEAVGRGKTYALEELVAEIGACCALENLGLKTRDSFMNSASYINNWLTALSNDTHMVVKAASRAEKAVRYIFNGPEGIHPCNDNKTVDYSEPETEETSGKE